MLRMFRKIGFSFGSYRVNNLFNKEIVEQFVTPSTTDFSSFMKEAFIDKISWKQLPSVQKEESIDLFVKNIHHPQNQQKCARLLSSCTGKQLIECQAQLKSALQVLDHQLKYRYHHTSIGQDGYVFEPFDAATCIFDHRHPLLASFSYLGLALRSNSLLLLRPSPIVLPPVNFIASLWKQSSGIGVIRCVVDSESDPKEDNSVMKTLINTTQGFMSFWGRLKDGLDFHYYMSQSNEVFRESQFMLTSSDSAYVMKDLNQQQLTKAARIIARGCFSNCGHNFNSIKRVFVSQEVSAQFQQLLLQEAQLYASPNPFSSTVNEGRLAPYLIKSEFQESLQVLQELKKNSSQFTRLSGGEPSTIKSQGEGNSELNFISPAIFRVETDTPSYKYQNIECMLPICFLSTVNSTQKCIELINSSIFGTTATLFTANTDFKFIQEIGKNLDVGTVNVNTWQVTGGIAYGGRKRSGKGFSLSPLSYNNLVRSKSVSYG